MRDLRPLPQGRSNWGPILTEEKGIVLITKGCTRLSGRKPGHVLLFISLMLLPLSFGSSSVLYVNVCVYECMCSSIVFECIIQWFVQPL